MRTEGSFWARVEVVDSGCWIWSGARNKAGYGNLYWRGRYTNAHRVAWELSYGETHGLSVLHHCDCPPCCNPKHLWLGTDCDNAWDKVSKGRAYRPNGSLSPTAVLNPRKAAEIRMRYSRGDTTFRALAEEYGVANSTISNIVTGLTWNEERAA